MVTRHEARAYARAFTLSELIAAMVVMLALSTVILPSASGGNGEQSLNNTTDMLEAIRKATLGTYDPVTKLWTGGYVQDMGGLPKYGSPATLEDPTHAFGALTGKPTNVLAWGPKTLSSKYDGGIVLWCGHRGHYLTGTKKQPLFHLQPVVDGFGNPYAINTHPQSPAFPGLLSSVQSMGGPEPYNNPIPSPDPMLLDITPQLETVTGYVTYELPSWVVDYDGRVVFVKLYEPDPNTGGIRVRQSPPIFFNGDKASPTNEFGFANVVQGRRALRVIMRPIDPVSEEAGVQTETMYIDVPEGGLSGIHFHMVAQQQNPPPEDESK